MSFKIIDYSPDIVEMMNLREEQKDNYATKLQLSSHSKLLYRSSSFAKVLTHNGRIVACFGAYKCWGTMFEAWMLVDEQAPEIFKENPIALVKLAHKIMGMFPKVATRLQTHVRADFKMGQRFVETLGFKKEGLARKYGPTGLDYYSYAKIKEN